MALWGALCGSACENFTATCLFIVSNIHSSLLRSPLRSLPVTPLHPELPPLFRICLVLGVNSPRYFPATPVLLSRFRPREIPAFLCSLSRIVFGYLPPLHPTLYTLHYIKIALKCDFSCISPKIIVPLHRKGQSTTIAAGSDSVKKRRHIIY